MELDENINSTFTKTFNSNTIIITKLINSINNNHLSFDDNFPLTFENNYNKLYFLNNKRNSSNKKQENKNFNNHNDSITNFYNNEIIKSLKNIKKKKIFNIIKTVKNNKKKFFTFNHNLYKIQKSNYIFLNKSDKIKNELNNSIVNNDNDNICINENIDSNDINLQNNINKTSNFSNQVKVKKNNKLVYANKSLIKPKLQKKNCSEKKDKRNSIYRGVSKNGNKWQVILFYNSKQRYIGTYDSQEIAARIYDILSIKNKGIKAKTNFVYNIHQIQKISESSIDYNSEFIDELIYDLIK